MVKSIKAIFEDRRNMAQTLKDTESIVKSLEFGMAIIANVIAAAIFAAVLGYSGLEGFSVGGRSGAKCGRGCGCRSRFQLRGSAWLLG